MTVPIPTDAYETALGEPLPDSLEDTMMVDRRGYAEVVAEELGEDYLSGILIFSPEQAEAPLLRAQNSYLPELVDAVYTDAEMVDYVSPAHPLHLQVSLRSSGGSTRAHAYITDSDTINQLEQAINLRGTVYNLTRNDLESRERIETLVDLAEDVNEMFGDPRDIEIDRNAASIEVSRYSFETDTSCGYWFSGTHSAFNTEIITSEESPPGKESAGDRYNIHEETGDILETLVDIQELSLIEQDRNHPDAYGIDSHIRRIGRGYLSDQGLGDLSGPAFYRKLQEHWEDLPVEAHHLQELKQGDFSIETEDAMVKLDYLKPESGEAFEVLDAIYGVLEDGTFPDAEPEPTSDSEPYKSDYSDTGQLDTPRWNDPLFKNFDQIVDHYQSSSPLDNSSLRIRFRQLDRESGLPRSSTTSDDYKTLKDIYEDTPKSWGKDYRIKDMYKDKD